MSMHPPPPLPHVTAVAYCTSCGGPLSGGDVFCQRCGFPVNGQREQLGDNAGMRLLLPVGRSGWAIAAGYLGLFSMVVVPAPLALIISIIAIMDIHKSKNAQHPKHGMGRAIFGLVMGLLGTVVLVMILISSLKS